MTRAMSIVLIVAIALQTVGCTAWRPLARMNEVGEANRELGCESKFWRNSRKAWQ